MQHLSLSGQQILTWTRRAGREYVLRRGDEVYGDLVWDSMFSSRAVGTTADGQWVVARDGHLHLSVTAHGVNRGLAAATLKRVRQGLAAVQLSSGLVYYWKGTEQRGGGQGCFAAGGELVFGITPRSHWLHLDAELSITPGQECCRDLSLLVLVGWYYLVIENDDDMESAAAACLAVI